MTNYLENKIVDAMFRNIAYTWPTTLAIGLFTVAPSDTGGGTEVTGGSYARVSLNPLYSNWKGTGGETTNTPSTGTSGTTSNNSVITFPAPTANWGSIQAVGIFDATSGGNLLLYNNLTIPKTVNNGDSAPSFAIDALQVQIDN